MHQREPAAYRAQSGLMVISAMDKPWISKIGK